MIIGNGLIASLFKNIDREDTVFFASGVSNSLEEDKAQFQREENLVKKTINENPDKIFLYFSTCSIYDSSKTQSHYVLHKIRIEQIITELCSRYLILRVSNVVGEGGNPNLLMNYLYRQIINENELSIHQYATRNLIDKEDVKNITLKYLNSDDLNKIVNVAYLENYYISEIVETFESFLGKRANKNLIDLGEHYSINIHNLKYDFVIKSKSDYLKDLVIKYFKNTTK